MHFPIAGTIALPVLALPVFVLVLAGCAGSGNFPAPTAKNVAYAERHGQVTTLPTLKVGRKLYLSRCSECHSLKAPEFLSPEEWPEMVQRMATDAKINSDQERAITQYLISISAAVRDTAAGSAVPPPGAASMPPAP